MQKRGVEYLAGELKHFSQTESHYKANPSHGLDLKLARTLITSCNHIRDIQEKSKNRTEEGRIKKFKLIFHNYFNRLEYFNICGGCRLPIKIKYKILQHIVNGRKIKEKVRYGYISPHYQLARKRLHLGCGALVFDTDCSKCNVRLIPQDIVEDSEKIGFINIEGYNAYDKQCSCFLQQFRNTTILANTISNLLSISSSPSAFNNKILITPTFAGLILYASKNSNTIELINSLGIKKKFDIRQLIENERKDPTTTVLGLLNLIKLAELI